VLIVSAFSARAVSHLSLTKYLELMNDPDQKGVLSHASNHLSASDPTSSFFALRCSKSSVVASFSTPPSPVLECRCCIDRLRSQEHSGHSETAKSDRQLQLVRAELSVQSGVEAREVIAEPGGKALLQ
jgi:hypothetical protein